MSNSRKIRHRASSTEEKQATTEVPEKEKPRTLLFPALWLCGSLVMLGIGVHALVTGKTLFVDAKVRAVPARWSEFIASVFLSVMLFAAALDSYSPELKRRVGAFISAPLFFLGGLALLVYDVYGLATNNLRMLFFGGFSSSGGIFLFGLPVLVLFLAYLSFSFSMITVAVTRLMKGGNEALYMKIDKLGDKALVLALILYIAAAVLANKLNLHH